MGHGRRWSMSALVSTVSGVSSWERLGRGGSGFAYGVVRPRLRGHDRDPRGSGAPSKGQGAVSRARDGCKGSRSYPWGKGGGRRSRRATGGCPMWCLAEGVCPCSGVRGLEVPAWWSAGWHEHGVGGPWGRDEATSVMRVHLPEPIRYERISFGRSMPECGPCQRL